jgi:hypothetical protein
VKDQLSRGEICGGDDVRGFAKARGFERSMQILATQNCIALILHTEVCYGDSDERRSHVAPVVSATGYSLTPLGAVSQTKTRS